MLVDSVAVGLPLGQALLFFPECVAKGSRFTFLGGLGVDTCSRDPAFGVRKRPRTTVVGVKLLCLWGKPQNRVFVDVLEDVLMSFCVRRVTL